MTGYSSARTPILGKVYIYNYVLSVIVVKVPTDSETSPWAQFALSALVEDRLTVSIQVVTRRQSPLSGHRRLFNSDRTTIATFPAFQDDLQSASPLYMRPRIRVNAVGTNICG